MSNAPAGSALLPTNADGSFVWTNAAPAGVYTTSFYAADNDGANSETIRITVGTGTEKPVFQAIGNKTVIQIWRWPSTSSRRMRRAIRSL